MHKYFNALIKPCDYASYDVMNNCGVCEQAFAFCCMYSIQYIIGSGYLH